MAELKPELPPFSTLPVRIIVPVALTIGLFIITIFLIILPMLEQQMLDGRREALQRLSEVAWSTVAHYHDAARQGRMSDQAARQAAIAHLQSLRYGPELKDYFWINDLTPVMIMHPYRLDLVNRNVSEFQDPSGKRLFADMAELVRTQKFGFVQYQWQWQEDSDRIVPKISYVKGFAPWEWILGTGLYVEDVRLQISAITRQISWACLGITLLVLLLSAFIIWEAAGERKQRLKALQESMLREKQLIHADKMVSLGILAAGVAHEVNNPVTTIMLNAPSLKKAWESFQPVLDGHYAAKPNARVCNIPYTELRTRIGIMLDAVQEGALRIKRIISELRDFSGPGVANGDQAVDINQIVEKSVELTRTITRKATRCLDVQYDATVPPVQGNFQKLQQVVINLLVNAAQALSHPDQAIRVRTYLHEDAGYAAIEVADEGAGADAETMTKMAEPFFTTRRDNGGVGLGLSISRKIVHDHRGMLEFESLVGNGMTVRVILPCQIENTS